MPDSELDRMVILRDAIHNFYGADPNFPELIRHYNPDALGLEERLAEFSGLVKIWDPIIEGLDTNGLYPIIMRGKVKIQRDHKKVRSEVVRAGIFDNESQLEQFAKVYLLSHMAEAGVVCPLACTVGLVRVINAVGSEFLKETYLPKLFSSKNPLLGGQFITEKDAGSDVGRIETKAIPTGQDEWLLYGTKWFCSAGEGYALVAARPEGALPGTEGVAIFFMPIILDGKINNLKIKKLKDKTGTRLLPTAEIDLNGAVAYNIGTIENGFKNLMNYVINTSRLMNSAASLGMAARAYLEARNHASQRMAFGYTIDNYPMIQDSLNGMYSTLAAHRALYFDLVRRLDTNPIDDFKSDEALWQRFLINLCKYRTSIAATNCANEARGIIGANSVDKSFPNYNIVIRLLEDAPILEIWEGAHNVLAEQVARDSHRFHDKTFKQYLDEAMGRYVTNLNKNGFVITSQWIEQNWAYTKKRMRGLADKEWSEIFALKLLDRLGGLLETAVYATVVGNPDSLQASYVAHYRNNVKMPSLELQDLRP